MTTTSPICTIKTRLAGTNNIQTFTNGTYELKPSRISVKKPLNGTHFLPSTSNSHDFGYPLKKRNFPLNPFYAAKSKLHQLTDDHRESTKQNEIHDEFSPSTPSFIFEAVSPGSADETNPLSTDHKINEQSKKDLTSINGQHHPNLGRSTLRQSSCSDVEQLPNGSRVLLSMDDTDADESDNGQKEKSKKSRRLQKTRKSSNSSIQQIHPTPPVPRTNLRIEEQRRSSSNDDDENQESISRLSEIYFPNRRFKISASKKSQQLIFTTTTATTTTTTDDELTKKTHRVDILNQLNSKSDKTNSTTNDFTPSSPNPTISAAPSVRKINRFQVKAIRKSQQAHILLANAVAAKSSNDDDCSVPNERSINQIRPTIIDRINTPTTDGESSRINSIDLSQRTQNDQNEYHHVRFKVASHGKRESTVEEEKLSAPSTNNNASVTTSVPPSSATPAQGEDDEEEEAVGISPDGRFIKYAKEIGRGAFKTVYRGLDTETSVAVAWCELQDFAQFDKHERARFKEEAEMLKKLQHQNIVRFYDFWEETNPRTNKKVIILVTELMTSGSLKGYIRKFKGQKEEKRINVMKKWCRQILKGLAYLHSRNPPVIHRDLKCDNVFISSTTGCVKIGDLGLATFKTQTFAKSMRGTMEFMAPEMFDEKYDELVDIYSFGLCMLEMITGEYPYIECKGPTAVIKRVTAGLKPDCYYRLENEDVREVIDCCIRTKKEERLPVNELLQHSFFLDDNGLRIDLVRDTTNDAETMIRNELIDFKLKITDKSKRKVLWTEHEAIRFRYNLKNDVPEQIADELIQKKYIVEDDKKFVTQSIKDRLRSYQYEQIDRKAGVFTRDVKTASANQTPLMGQTTAQSQQPTPQLPTTPLVVPPPVVPVLNVTPNNSTVPDSSQAVVIKPTPELSQTKPLGPSESVSIGPLPELSSTVSGSTRSLEVLDAALKKTFNKTNSNQNVNPTSNPVTDSSEPPTPVIYQDDSVLSRPASHSISISDQQIIDDISDIPTMDTITQPCPSSNGVISQIQVQPQAAVILTSHPMKVSTNPSYITQTSQNLNFPLPNGPQPFLATTTTNNDSSVKQILPSSSSSATTDGIENAQISVALPHTNESISNTILSDIPSTTPPQISGSLKQLDVLLAHTFKSSGKTAGTAYNSDTETTATATMMTTPPIPLNDDHLVKVVETDSDDAKRKIFDLFNSSSTSGSQTGHSQPTTSSTLPPSTIKQTRAQTTSIQNPSPFDPFISPERIQDQRETLMKTPLEKSSSNDDTIVAASANDLSDIKSMIADLSKSLMHKMAVIEQKIDQHHEQTERINQLLTHTVLPSLFDITDIIHETSSHLDPRVRSKLDHIRTSVRTIKQQSDVQDLMEI